MRLPAIRGVAGIVVRHASITQFRELCCSSYSVVSLIAHWRSARFRAGDIVNFRGSDDVDAQQSESTTLVVGFLRENKL